MPAEELSFRVAYEGPLTEFTRAHPGATVSLWCDWKREALEVGGVGPADVEALLKSVDAASSARRGGVSERTWTELFTVEHNHHIVLFACLGLAHDYVLSAIDRAQCLALPPTRFEQGWEVYHVVSFSEQRSRTLLKAVRDGGREVELLSKKRLTVRPMLNTRGAGVNALFDGLTEKQLDALVQAHRHGLYASPRRTTAANIADGLGVSRSTYEEHLRKAESRLVGNLVPYLELYLKAQRATQAGQN